MSSRQALVRLPAALAALALLKACGESDGPTTLLSVPPSIGPRVSIRVSPPTTTLTARGETVQLSAVGHAQDGREIALTWIRWNSLDSDVARVDESGLVTAWRVDGTTPISAYGHWRIGSLLMSEQGYAWVTVRRDVAAMEVTPSAEIVFAGHTLRLSAKPRDGNGYAVTEAAFAWESSDTAVATVASTGSSGLVQGVAPGVATISVTADQVEATAEITVVPDPERAALSALYTQTEGTSWSNDDHWLTDAPLGEWYGVVTDDSARVVTLNLDANGLSGRIPPELGNLTRLQTLDLGSNDLSGPIPSELGNLAELATLGLGNNRLAGGVPPELGNLTKLQTLNLAHNELEDTIPPELGELGELVTLRLTDNRLTGGVPPELGNLSRLETLDLAANDLVGPMPPELGNLTSLTSLALGVTRLSGPIPPEIGELTSLLSLSLWAAGLSGPLPPELGNLVDLRYLNLSRNRLTGTTPRRLLQLTSLSLFFFERNDGLCAPGTTEFSTWLRSIGNVRGPLCDAPSSVPARPRP